MKTCTKCNQTKDLTEFPKQSSSKDGYNNHCKPCINLRNRQYRENNKEYFSKMRKKHYKKNRSKLLAQKAKYVAKNKDKKAKYDKQYRKNNADKIRLHKKNWEKKHKNNPIFKIKRNLRRRIHHLVKGQKSDHTFNLIGCNAEEFKIHIESQFKPGMTWNNYGSHWHIDHIIPCCTFDLSKESEQRKCFHYTNQQPLWKEENLKKGRRTILK